MALYNARSCHDGVRSDLKELTKQDGECEVRFPPPADPTTDYEKNLLRSWAFEQVSRALNVLCGEAIPEKGA